MTETFSATLTAARLVTPRVRELTFERTDGKPFVFRAGQWVSVVMPFQDEKGRPVRRSYSLASVPSEGSAKFELVVTRVEGGKGSAYLHDAPVGTVLEVKGPQGHFERPVDAGPSLFVATGTGVAPFRGMVHEAVRAGANASPLWILFGVRSAADALYREELEALAREHSKVRFLLTYSQPVEGWTGRTGYVQKHALELWKELASFGTPHAYVCGVRKMLLEVRDLLKTQGGAERAQLHLESYD